MVVDILVAIRLADMTEILIQGTGEEDHDPLMVEEDRGPHMTGGGTIILTHIGDTENARCPLVAVATLDRANQFH